MTFLSGFAQSYIAADQRKQDREQDLEDTQFKYKMQDLMSMKELRTKKQMEETENAKKAQALALQNGDASTAPFYNTQLNNGVGYDTLFKANASGDFKPNPNYTKPTQTVQVPAAVSMNYDDTGTDTPQYANVNKRIDAIDPTLRKGAVTPTVADDNAANMLIYNPKSQKNLPDLPTALDQYKTAQASQDPKAIRDSKQVLDSVQSAKVWEAQASARAQGKTGQQKGVILDDSGKVVPGGLVYSETREDPDNPGQYKTYNMSDPTVNNGQGVPISGNFRQIDDATYSRMNTIRDQFGKDSADTKGASANYIAALNSANIMQKIAKEDPSATTKYVGGSIEMLNNMKGEAGAAWKQLSMVEQKLNEDRQNHDEDSLEKDAAAHTKALSDFFNATLTSPANEKTAINAALYRSARTSVINNISTANGLSQSKSSDKDYEHYQAMIGGEDPSWNTIGPVVQQALGDSLVNIDAKRDGINSNPSPKQFKNETGIDLDLNVPRIQDMIAQSDMDPQRQAELIGYLKSIRQPLDYGQAVAGQQGAQQSGQYRDPVVNAQGTKAQGGQANQSVQDQISSGQMTVGTIMPGADGKKYKYIGGFDPKKGLQKENFEEVK